VALPSFPRPNALFTYRQFEQRASFDAQASRDSFITQLVLFVTLFCALRRNLIKQFPRKPNLLNINLQAGPFTLQIITPSLHKK
jgi:hypothetical protein